MREQKRRLTQQDLRALGVQPGLIATRYLPGEDRARVEQLASDSRGPYRREIFTQHTDSERS